MHSKGPNQHSTDSLLKSMGLESISAPCVDWNDNNENMFVTESRVEQAFFICWNVNNTPKTHLIQASFLGTGCHEIYGYTVFTGDFQGCYYKR